MSEERALIKIDLLMCEIRIDERMVLTDMHTGELLKDSVVVDYAQYVPTEEVMQEILRRAGVQPIQVNLFYNISSKSGKVADEKLTRYIDLVAKAIRKVVERKDYSDVITLVEPDEKHLLVRKAVVSGYDKFFEQTVSVIYTDFFEEFEHDVPTHYDIKPSVKGVADEN